MEQRELEHFFLRCETGRKALRREGQCAVHRVGNVKIRVDDAAANLVGRGIDRRLDEHFLNVRRVLRIHPDLAAETERNRIEIVPGVVDRDSGGHRIGERTNAESYLSQAAGVSASCERPPQHLPCRSCARWR